jgi:Raf kinase inhibitor-like YbhB/YbcL family protein
MHLDRNHVSFVFVALLLGSLAAGCSKPKNAEASKERSTPMTITIRSAGFADDQSIPQKYTCDGEDVSPSLSWDNAPDGTKSFALICDDPDAPSGTWVHWVIYDLSAGTRELPEAIPAKEEVLSGARQGTNDFKRIGYGGPCPPKGNAHRYYFKLYALDSVLNLKAGATKGDVENAMKGHALGEGTIMGTYKRK